MEFSDQFYWFDEELLQTDKNIATEKMNAMNFECLSVIQDFHDGGTIRFYIPGHSTIHLDLTLSIP